VLMGYVLCEKTAFIYVPFNEKLLSIISTISFLSFLYYKVISPKGVQIRLDSILKGLLIYIIYLSISSFITFFFDETRNWFWTYAQSFFLVFIVSHSIKTYDELKLLMKWLIIFGFFSASAFIFNSGSMIFETEMEKSNLYGRLFLILAIFCFTFYIEPSNKNHIKYIYLLLLLFFTFCILLTGSRTSLLIYIALGIYFFVQNRRLNISLLFLVLIFLSALFFLLPEDFVVKVISTFDDSTFEGGSGDTEFNSFKKNIRLLMWEASITMLNDGNCLFGIGVCNFKYLMPRYLPFIGLQASHPHNTYVSVLVESGIVGLSIFLYFIYKGFVYFRSYRYLSSNSYTIYLEGLFISFIVFLIGGLTKHDHYEKLLFLFLGIASAIYKININSKNT